MELVHDVRYWIVSRLTRTKIPARWHNPNNWNGEFRTDMGVEFRKDEVDILGLVDYPGNGHGKKWYSKITMIAYIRKAGCDKPVQEHDPDTDWSKICGCIVHYRHG